MKCKSHCSMKRGTVESAEIEQIAARLVQRVFGMEVCSVPVQLDRVLEELQISLA